MKKTLLFGKAFYVCSLLFSCSIIVSCASSTERDMWKDRLGTVDLDRVRRDKDVQTRIRVSVQNRSKEKVGLKNLEKKKLFFIRDFPGYTEDEKPQYTLDIRIDLHSENIRKDGSEQTVYSAVAAWKLTDIRGPEKVIESDTFSVQTKRTTGVFSVSGERMGGDAQANSYSVYDGLSEQVLMKIKSSYINALPVSGRVLSVFRKEDGTMNCVVNQGTRRGIFPGASVLIVNRDGQPEAIGEAVHSDSANAVVCINCWFTGKKKKEILEKMKDLSKIGQYISEDKTSLYVLCFEIPSPKNNDSRKIK